jgi:hypothetical protein
MIRKVFQLTCDSPLMQAEEGQNGHDDNDKAYKVNDSIHDFSPIKWF